MGLRMKVTHLIINNDDCIGIIYHNEKYGRIVVFRTSKVDIEFPVKLVDGDGKEDESDLIELIVEVLPK